MTTNELQLAKAFRDAGLEQDKAEAIAQTIFDAIRDNVATKSDLGVAEQTLRGEIQLARSEIQLGEQRLRSEIQSLKIWAGGIAAAAVSALFAALHYWPPHS